MIVVEQPGPLTSVQDLGRPGCADLGVSPSGAADRPAHRLANRLVGNPEGRATLETTMGGLVITTTALVWIAVTGAPTRLSVNDRDDASHTPLAGQELEVGRTSRPLPNVEVAPPNQPRKTLDLSAGPRRDWFTARAWTDLINAEWTATPDQNRVAVRLAGPSLTRSVIDELPSEGLIRGAIQVPASGQPLIFLADHRSPGAIR